MAITPNPPANFTPTQGNYKSLQPFRYWCQKVLPLVYDDSLSYYELLCKVVDYLNKTMEDVETLHGDVDNLHDAYVELQAYVNNYFSTLDVQQEINNKLDVMAEDGTLSALVDPFVPPAVDDKIDRMVQSGELAQVVSPFVPPAVSDKVDNMVGDGTFGQITNPQVVTATNSKINSMVSSGEFAEITNPQVITATNSKINNMVSTGQFSDILDGVVGDDAIPLFVSSTSEMTNRSRIYVLTSSSHVYKYDSTTNAFVDTGISYGITDSAVMSSKLVLQASNLHGYSDANDFPVNKILAINNDVTEAMIAHLPVYGSGAGILLTTNYDPTHTYIAKQEYVILNTRQYYVRTSYYSGGGTAWSPWNKVAYEADVVTPNVNGVAEGSLQGFTSFDDFPANSVYTVYANALSHLTHAPNTTYSLTVFTIKGDRTIQLAFSAHDVFYRAITDNNWASLGGDTEIINLIRQYAISSSDTDLNHSNLHGFTDANDITNNSIYSIAGSVTESDIAHLPTYGIGGLLVTGNCFNNQKYSAFQLFAHTAVSGNEVYFRTAYYNNSTPNYVWKPWVLLSNNEHITRTFTFASARQQVDTGICLKAGETYGIYTNKFGQRINVWSGADTTNYKSNTYGDYFEFTPVTAGTLKIYNADSKTGDITLDIFYGDAKKNYENITWEYTVDTNGGGDYTEITACYKDLARDNRKKKIYIKGGLYDIATEYANNNIPVCPSDVDPVTNFIPYNVYIPENSHVIGIGGTVTIKYEKAIADTSYNEAYSVSPVNVLGSCILENVVILCKNGRYCIHDDCMELSYYNGSKHEYRNVECVKYERELFSDTRYAGTPHCVGFGFNPYIDYEFKNCKFDNRDTGGTFYGHNRIGFGGLVNDYYNSPRITHENSVFKGNEDTTYLILLDNSYARSGGNIQEIKSKFIGCYGNGEIHIADSNNREQGNKENSYLVTLLNCSDGLSLNILDPNNSFTPEIYPWISTP